MLPFRKCGGASDSADAARTSGSWANCPDLPTRCFGRRAEKKENRTNHIHLWNAGVGSNEAERKHGTIDCREPMNNSRKVGFAFGISESACIVELRESVWKELCLKIMKIASQERDSTQ